MPKRANFNVRNMFNNSVLKRNMSMDGADTDPLQHEIHGGELLLDKGLGGSYQSPEEFTRSTGKPLVGLGASFWGKQQVEKLKSFEIHQTEEYSL